MTGLTMTSILATPELKKGRNRLAATVVLGLGAALVGLAIGS